LQEGSLKTVTLISKIRPWRAGDIFPGNGAEKIFRVLEDAGEANGYLRDVKRKVGFEGAG